jgi:hypothetical protein
MSQASTDQIIAHAALLRAVDSLLSQAEVVRAKREALNKAIEQSSHGDHEQGAEP